MKTIELKKASELHLIGKSDKTIEFSTVSLIKAAVNTIPEGGLTPSDMLIRIRILDKLDSLSEDATHLELEDSEVSNLKVYVAPMKWSVVSRFILDFTQQFS